MPISMLLRQNRRKYGTHQQTGKKCRMPMLWQNPEERRENTMGMDSLNDMFFTSTASESLSYDQILEDVQKYCTEKHSDKLSTEGNQEEARKLLREFIFQYVISRSYRMEGMTTEELCDSLYEDMAGISF